MRCIIIDDEPLALELLEDNIRLVDGLHLVASCRSAAQALAVMQDTSVDLVFCDINMPGINGLQFVKSLQQKPMVIFITAYQEFALDGFDLDVIDYLLKPVPVERFLKACNKARAMFDLQRKFTSELTGAGKKHLFVYSEYTLIKLSFSDISYIEGLKDYVKLYVKGYAKPILSRMTIKTLMDQLPADEFFRTHKSYIINLAYVQSIRNGKLKFADVELPYGENYKDVIMQMTGRAV